MRRILAHSLYERWKTHVHLTRLSIRENKIGKTFPKYHVCEEDLIKKVQGTFTNFRKDLPVSISFFSHNLYTRIINVIHSRSAFGAESAFPLNFQLAIVHASLVVGEAKMREKVTASVANTVGLEATELYPDTKYVTIEECMCMDGL